MAVHSSLTPGAAPPDRGVDSPQSSNVPAAFSSFVGRAVEIRQIRAALAANRLLTVVGPGGAGKTRLVREVAAAVAEESIFADGVRWVELAPVRSGAEVAGAVAAVIGLNPMVGRHVEDALADALRGQRLLLVLDNCEHLVADVARLVELLLRAAPELTIVCTSREALAIDAETPWPIRALPRPSLREHPSASAIADFEAVQLFVDRAGAVTPGFALNDANARAIVTVCERLDGLPLALELAAAVVPVLGIEVLADRIDDALTLLSRGRRTALPRHRTLHAVLDWSYALLDESERALLRRLSVFRGTFTLDALEAVGAGDPVANVVSALGRLVEHSLIEVLEVDGEARYRLLETVRQFGSALLGATPEEHEIRRRHATWVERVSREAEAALFSPARGRTVDRLRHSIDEIRAALKWATGPGASPSLALEIGGALSWFWFSGLPWEEARELLTSAIAAADAHGVPDPDRSIDDRLALGRLLYPLKGLAFFAGDTAAMLEIGRRESIIWDSVDAMAALTPAQRYVVDRGRSLALQLDGIARGMRGEGELAHDIMNRSVELAERSGDPWMFAVMTIRRALVYFMTGDYQKAKADYDAGVPSLRALGELWFSSLALEGMAMNAIALGDDVSAMRHVRESVMVLAPEPDPWFISRSLDTMAFVLISRAERSPVRGDSALPMAARLIGAAESLRKRCGAGVIGPDIERNAAMMRTLCTNLGDDAFAQAHAAGASLSLDDVFALVRSLEASDATPVQATPPVRHRLDLRVLGRFEMSVDAVASSGDAVPVGKTRELLLFLLLHDGTTKDDVGLALWPDSSAAQVRNLFHVTLHHLRRLLGSARWIAFDHGRYRLARNPADDTQLTSDVDDVLATSARLRQALRRRETIDVTALDAAREVFERHRGELAPGFAAGDWLVAAQDRVRSAWVDGVDALAQLYEVAGHVDGMIGACELLVAREPLREAAHRLLMEAYDRRGERARALSHYESLAAMLGREVQARPSAETRALAERLKR